MSFATRAFRRIEGGLAELVRQLQLIESFEVAPTDLVLDVGSGQNPSMRANVLCDRFLFDNSERACGGRPISDRPLVVADAERLPFRDRAFDFVVCSHLLEHVRHPEKLAAELQRVAARGYIETPSRVHERLYGNPFHKWFVSRRNGALHLSPKPTATFSDEITSWFRGQLDHHEAFRDLVGRRLDELGFLVRYQWSGAIDIEVDGSLTSEEDFVFASSAEPVELDLRPHSPGQKLRSLLGRFHRRRSELMDARLPELLVCSCCGAGPLRRDGDAVSCSNGHRFPVRNNLFFVGEEFEGKR
jgi:SAM-dependent methyltransferase